MSSSSASCCRDDGQASLQVTVPDTITEWNANTFCVADIGFGFSPLTSLRVFQPFFVDVSLPYSVIQGETFKLKATVFNYLKECIQVGLSKRVSPITWPLSEQDLEPKGKL